MYHSVLIRDDGGAVAFGNNVAGQCHIPERIPGTRYIAAAAGTLTTVLVCEDGSAVAYGDNDQKQCEIPEAPARNRYIGVQATTLFTVLIRENGEHTVVGEVDDENDEKETVRHSPATCQQRSRSLSPWKKRAGTM
jgi:alpha-tubulin suppressor-like RCC1 family protein